MVGTLLGDLPPQFTNDEDDLFETLNDSLHRDDVGQHGLDEQLEGFWPGDSAPNTDVMREYNEWKSRAMPENGIPDSTRYEFRMSNRHRPHPEVSHRQSLKRICRGRDAVQPSIA